MEIIVDCYGEDERAMGREGLAVPFCQLEVIHAEDDGETQEAVEDWLYWTNRGYRF